MFRLTVCLLAGLVFAWGCAARDIDPPRAPPPPPPPGPMTNEELVSAFGEIGLEARDTERGVVVYVPSTYLFAFDSHELSEDALASLLEVASVLNRPRVSRRTLSVEGHTDSVGDPAYNLDLSERRAQAVMDQLAVGSVATARMRVHAWGEDRPRAPNERSDGIDSPEGRALNRRVELVIDDLGTPSPDPGNPARPGSV